MPNVNLQAIPNYKQKPKKVIALQETRLSSGTGHDVVIPARIPTYIPWPLWEDAARNGCVDYNPALANDMIKALQEATELDKASDVDVKAASDPRALIVEAVRSVMLIGDKSAFTGAGVPKVAAVKVALDRVRADQGVKVDVALDREIVYDVFLELQDVKPEAAAVPDIPAGALGDEESGGDVEDMLARVGPGED